MICIPVVNYENQCQARDMRNSPPIPPSTILFNEMKAEEKINNSTFDYIVA